MKRLAGILFVFILTGCVTTHTGSTSNVADEKLAVSCATNQALSHEYFLMYSCTFENLSDTWLEIEVDKVTPDKKGGEFKVSNPTEVQDYLTALRFEIEKDNHNTQMALLGIGAGGLLVAAAAGDSTTSNMGAAAALGAVGTSAAVDLDHRHSHVQYAFSKGHISGGAFRVPANMFTRKKLLVERGQKTQPESLEVCFKKPTTECQSVRVAFPTNSNGR